MNKFWCKKGHFNLDQANLFKEMVEKYNPEYALETGFCTGRSASAVLTNANKLKKMISVDINFDYNKPEGRIYQKLLKDNFSNFSTIEKSSRELLNETFLKEEFPNGIDWFTVDGDHSYDGCLFDLTAVVNHINKNGILIVDDYKSGPPNGYHLPEVTKACDDFYKKNQYLERAEWNCNGKGFCIFKKPYFYKSGIKIGSRPKNHIPDIMGTNEEPWMTRESINWLYNYIVNNPIKNLKLLEYGCGSSTVYFLSLGLIVTSIEHHDLWLSSVKNKLTPNLLNNWIPYLIKNQKEGLYEGSDGEYYDDYVNYVNHNKLKMFDIIIVDGRCRSKCIEKSIKKLNSGGLFIVNNAERKSYQKSIDDNIPKHWKKHVFPTPVDTTIIWIKPIFSHRNCSGIPFNPILCPTHTHKYPPFINDKTIEEYILNRISKEKPDLNFVYIPILWTNMIWKPHNEKNEIHKLYNNLIKQLAQSNPNKRFITICQNADGPIFPIPKNTIVWGGSVGHIPMPLIYEDKTNYLENLPKKKFIDKSILCSFIGSMTTSTTSKVRETIHNKFKNNKNFYFSTDNWQLEVEKKRQQDFVDITLDSKFCLAPRGYGRSSFRFFEAFLLKSIPIYIWDDVNWLPYKERIDYGKFCIILNITDIDKLESILINIDEDKYQDMWREYEKIKHYFTLDGLYNYFIDFCKLTNSNYLPLVGSS